MQLIRFWNFACLGSIHVVLTFFRELRRQKGLKLQGMRAPDLSRHEDLPAKENELAVSGFKKGFSVKYWYYALHQIWLNSNWHWKNRPGLSYCRISCDDHRCKSQGSCNSKSLWSGKSGSRGSIPPPSPSTKKEDGQNLGNEWDALHRP